MHHRIPTDQIGSNGERMAEAVQACVHCGFCLPSCPTYQVLGEEMDSPRGRIYLMKQVLEGELEQHEAQPYLDKCLGCMACETACPSGVQYGELLMPFRERAESERRPRAIDRLKHWLVMQTLPYPTRFRWAARLGRLALPFRPLTPKALRPMLELLPEKLPAVHKLPEVTPAQGQRRARVALLAGCVQQALAPNINRATIDVLSRNGVEVLVPQGQACCGALAWHVGDAKRARRTASANLDAFDVDRTEEVDAILTNAAGCGSGLKDYPVIFAGGREEARARRLAERVMDVSVFLEQLEIEPPSLPQPTRVAYHDACHLVHAQGVAAAPRRLLRQIENLSLVELDDGKTCCGSAGTYNIDQPALAAELGERKAAAIRRSGAEMVVAGNIGCLVQIQNHLNARGKERQRPRVMHTMELLQAAYQGSRSLAAH